MPSKTSQWSRREREIMDIICARGESSASDVDEHRRRDPAGRTAHLVARALALLSLTISAVAQLKEEPPPLPLPAPKEDSANAAASVFGTWKFVNHTDGHTAMVALNDDYTYTSGGYRIGSWKISGGKLVIALDRGGHVDSYHLPVRDGTLNGVNRLGHALTLTQVKPEGDKPEVGDIFGTWSFTNHTVGQTFVVEVNKDKTYSAAGKRIGKWEIVNRQLVISLDEGGHVDRYNLPVKDRKLNGVNELNHALVLQRKAE